MTHSVCNTLASFNHPELQKVDTIPMSGCTVTRSTTLSSSTSTYSPSNQTGVASSNSSLISLQYEEQSKLTLRRNFQRILLLHSDTHHNKSSPSTRGSSSSVSTSTVRDQISVTSQGTRTHAQVSSDSDIIQC